MLETTTQPGGTAARMRKSPITRRRQNRYRAQGGCRRLREDNYNALFAGIVPATDPRLVAAMVIDNPKKGQLLRWRSPRRCSQR
jgi:cell division protein FtsI (penicillin-binding protein 3)